MRNERVVCERQGDVVRFWYAHHPEQAWEIDIVKERPGQLEYNRALTVPEFKAIYEAGIGLT